MIAARPRLDADRLVRVSSIAVVVLVALGAAVVSYRHAYDLVHAHGETGTTAAIVPATVDGMIYASSMVLLQAARRGQRGSWLAYIGLALGVMATVAANVAHGWAHGLIGALVGAWPAVALVLSYEMLMWIVRAGHQAGESEAASPEHPAPGQERTDSGAPSEPSVCDHRPALNLAEAVIAARDSGMPLRALADNFQTTKYAVTKILDQAAEPSEPAAEDAAEDVRKWAQDAAVWAEEAERANLNGHRPDSVGQPE